MKTSNTRTLLVSASAIAAIAFAAGATARAQSAPAKAPAPVAGPKAARAAKPAADAAMVKGPIDAPIKVVEFADFMCPGCKAASVALNQYYAQQGDDINLTFKNFPLEKTCNPTIGQTVHNGACELALGSICAAEQGLFWQYHARIFSREWTVATRADVIENGLAAGLDKTKLQTCLNSPEASSKLAIQIKEGVAAPVQVTPTIVVNGKRLSQLNMFANAVDEERKKLPAGSAAASPKR